MMMMATAMTDADGGGNEDDDGVCAGACPWPDEGCLRRCAPAYTPLTTATI